MAEQLTIATTTHGRVLVEEAADASSSRLIVAFHGYAQRAEDVLDHVRRIPGVSQWRIASVQALGRFYARDQETVVASWMTRQDRELGERAGNASSFLRGTHERQLWRTASV